MIKRNISTFSSPDRGRSGGGFILLFLISLTTFSQSSVYEIDFTKQANAPVISENLRSFSGTSPDGTTLGVNNRYFTKNGKPWFPVMGEFHFTRYPNEYWEEEIVKMKSAGLSIVATYVFWNAHEYPKGTWDWSGDRDLKKFIELCRKHDMYVWLRIGPWSHGEQLYGGHPEWINKMRGKRSNNSKYLAEVKKLYGQIAAQVKGQFFKDGGPIIGIQLENEYAKSDKYIDHIGTLKKMALEAGMHPVYFSITGNSVFHDDKFEAIPLQGAYPYRGWEKGGGKATKDFLYANDQWILNDAVGKVYYDVTQYPKGMCEQGCGSQMTYRNRFVVKPEVVEAHLQNQIGRGMNLIGYYMFQGGTQMPGLKEPGYPESYDFQAPISEFGLLRPSYRYLKVLHNFIRDFGSDLAVMEVVEPEDPVRDELNTKDLRYVARVKGESGFLFLNNTQVRIPMPDKMFRMKVKTESEILEFPRRPVTLKGGRTAIFPVNLNVNGALLKYATAQPLSRFDVDGVQYLFLTRIEGTEVELSFDASTVTDIEAQGWKLENAEDKIFLNPEAGKVIRLTSVTGDKSVIVLLSRKEAENSWRTNVKGQEVLVLTEADIMMYKNKFELRRLDKTELSFKTLPALKNYRNDGEVLGSEKSDVFAEYDIQVEKEIPEIKIKNNTSRAFVEIPGEMPDKLSDIFLEIKYIGSDITAYERDRVLTDNLFNGRTWMFGLKRYMTGEPKMIRFEVKRWNDRIIGVPEELAKEAKKGGPVIKGINVHLQYRVVVEVK